MIEVFYALSPCQSPNSFPSPMLCPSPYNRFRIRISNKIFVQEVDIVVASKFPEESPWTVVANLRIERNGDELHAGQVSLPQQGQKMAR